MKIKIYIGYDQQGHYYSVYDCKVGLNNSCTSSVPYTSYYRFVQTFSNGSYCEFGFSNPLFYKGHAFQGGSNQESGQISGSSQEAGQIIGKDYSEILLDMDSKCSYILFQHITTCCQKNGIFALTDSIESL